ncbi:amino acid ABC transporter substrate-binding protein [Devosia aquimaris]|uniref:amino acid ABC transporter substrate-binding protein n=1 Tax=Devosia aquimaris TaxID=2866214 RepID=UPI001CD1174D|nr:amino acid ABC transporter substrate-binding protein [Devosia sp. CJK-A8-3]
MIIRATVRAVLAGLMLAHTLPLALAQAPVSTLERMRDTGHIRIGYSAEVPPFSYLGADGQVLGYSIDICNRVAELLGEQLALPDLTIDYVLRTPSNRVAMLNNGDIDIECVASTNTAERRKSVAFSYPHFMTSVQFIALRDGGPRRIAELVGHSVASTLGTTVIGQLNAVSREKGLNIAVVPTPDHQVAFDLMASGRVAAFAMDSIILSTRVANAKDPDLYIMSEDAFGPPEPYGLMMRHDDQPFVDAVNAALASIFSSGEINQIYGKWFTSPIPPKGINLHLPMSEALAMAFAAPAAVTD